jgi:hypothetical protein
VNILGYILIIILHCFGLVNSCIPEQLIPNGYTIDHGAKRGNNVASLLMKALHKTNSSTTTVAGTCQTPNKSISTFM